jgi:primosomal replication protein N
LSGRLLERGALRHTPAGIAVVEFRIAHASEQMEAGLPRRVECQMPCVLLGPMANLLSDAKPGDGIQVGGFLAAKSLTNPAPILHVNTMEFLEGN